MKVYKCELFNESTGEVEEIDLKDHCFAGAASKAYMNRNKKGMNSSWQITALWLANKGEQEK